MIYASLYGVCRELSYKFWLKLGRFGGYRLCKAFYKPFGLLMLNYCCVRKIWTSKKNRNEYNPQNEKLHRIKTKSCLAENETSPIKLHPTLAQ